MGGRWAVDSCGRCGESCILTLLRVRFAWQVRGMVAIGGAARVVLGDGRGDLCAQRVFRVAGVGNGVTWWVAGIVLRGRRQESCAAAQIAGLRGPARLPEPDLRVLREVVTYAAVAGPYSTSRTGAFQRCHGKETTKQSEM